jgi:mRNA interferase RelE/StbE
VTEANPRGTPHPRRLKFFPEALEEWNALDGSVKEVLRKALKKRQIEPHVPGSAPAY